LVLTPSDKEGLAEVLLDAVVDAILVIDSSMSLRYMNAATRAVLALGEPDSAELAPLDAVHPDDLSAVIDTLGPLFDGTVSTASLVFRVRHPEGRDGYKPVEANATSHMNTPGIEGVLVTFRDFEQIVEHMTLVNGLTNTLNASHDFLVIHSSDGTLLYANDRAMQRFGWTSPLPSEPWPYPGGVARTLLGEAIPAMRRDGVWHGEVALPLDGESAVVSISAVGRPAPTLPGEPPNLIICAGRVAQRREAATLVGLVDPITMLPNRRGVEEAVRQWRAQFGESFTAMHVMFEGVRGYADSPGYISAENLLWLIGARIRRETDITDLVAHIDTDTFLLVLGSNGDIDLGEHATRTASRLLEVMRQPFVLPDRDLYLRPIIGIAPHVPGEDPIEVIQRARIAAEAARLRKGHQPVEVYRPELSSRVDRRSASERAIRGAVEAGDVYPVYQPIVDLIDGQVIGVEALARARFEDRVIPPGEFVPVADDLDLLAEIDTMVMQQACAQLIAWNAPYLHLSVNVSAAQLLRPTFATVVADVLRQSHLQPYRLMLELTETNLYLDMEAAIKALARTRTLGVRIALDDFGTGYSSLGHLSAFSVDTIKIDRSFMQERSDRRIVDAVVQMARSLDLDTVAEGVEEPDQLDYLRSIGCPFGQGYLFAEPRSGEQIGELIGRGAPVLDNWPAPVSPLGPPHATPRGSSN
jgi:EAL domain-containing protein (putative c-di-GMP-specific phosphodiesterase class I)/GGDEF domain-containing protein